MPVFRRNTLVALAIVSCATIGLFTRLWVDDYCQLGDARAYGWLDATTHMYTHWAGLFTHFGIRHFLFSLTPLFTSFIPMLMLAWVFVLASAYQREWQGASGWALTLTLGVVLGMRSSQALYWSAVSMTYLAGMLSFATLLYVAYYRRAHGAWLWAFGFFASGWSETPAIVFVVAGGIWLLLRFNLRFAMIWGGAVLGLGVVMLAPGNAVRSQALYELSHYKFTLEQLPFVITESVGSIASLFTRPVGLIALCIGVYAGTQLQMKHVAFRAMALSLIVAIASGIVPSWVIKGTIENRTYVPSELALLGLFVLLGCWMGKAKNKQILSVFVWFGAWGLLIGNLLFMPDAMRYASAWDERHVTLSILTGVQRVHPLKYNWTMDGLGDMSNDWVNACVAWAYQIEGIIVE